MSVLTLAITWRITWTIVTLVVVEAIVCAVSVAPVATVFLWLADAVAGSRPWRLTVVALAIVPSYAMFALMLMIATPVAVAWLSLFAGPGAFGAGPTDALLLVGSGVATAVPLLWFAIGDRKVNLLNG